MAVVYMWYDIRNPSEVLYVGATVDFKKRRRHHIGRFKGKSNPRTFHRACSDRFQHSKMEAIEKCSLENKLERETFWWDLLKPMYGNRPRRTKEEVKKYRSEKVACPICNTFITRTHIARHKKLHTLKHISTT